MDGENESTIDAQCSLHTKINTLKLRVYNEVRLYKDRPNVSNWTTLARTHI